MAGSRDGGENMWKSWYFLVCLVDFPANHVIIIYIYSLDQWNHWLVVSNMNFIFHFIYGMSSTNHWRTPSFSRLCFNHQPAWNVFMFQWFLHDVECHWHQARRRFWGLCGSRKGYPGASAPTRDLSRQKLLWEFSVSINRFQFVGSETTMPCFFAVSLQPTKKESKLCGE